MMEETQEQGFMSGKSFCYLVFTIQRALETHKKYMLNRLGLPCCHERVIPLA
jgi:hypothetical protein